MKPDWQVKKLGDIVEFNPTERLPKGAIAKKISMDMLQPFTKDIFQYELQPYNGGAKFRNGDTIMARITPCLENGKVSKVNILTKDEVGFGSTEYIVLRAIPNVSDPDFIYYLTISDLVRAPAIKSMVGSSGRQRVQQNVLETLELPIPPYDEQKKIAAILSALDEKIAINRAINENLERQLDAFFENLFHGINGEVALGNVVKTISGGTPSRKHVDYYENGTICWVKSKELSSGYIFDTEEHINDLALAKSSAKIIPPHAILVAMYGATVGSYGIITKAMACNQAICALIDSEIYPYTYLYQIVRTQQRTLTNMAIGSAQQNISQILIKQLPLHNDTDTIAKFHTFAQPLQKRIELLEYENKQIMSIRDTLLPKLMSGEIDVSTV